MQRRGGSGQSIKGPRGVGPKSRKTPTKHATPAELQQKVTRLERDLDEALDRAVSGRNPKFCSGDRQMRGSSVSAR
jgi:hypothetical protein